MPCAQVMLCHVHNPDAEIRLNVDDSPVGLGGILEQKKKTQNNPDLRHMLTVL